MTDDFPYPDDCGQTHSHGCWKWPRHHNCAVARVRELEAENARLEQDLAGASVTILGLERRVCELEAHAIEAWNDALYDAAAALEEAPSSVQRHVIADGIRAMSKPVP